MKAVIRIALILTVLFCALGIIAQEADLTRPQVSPDEITTQTLTVPTSPPASHKPFGAMITPASSVFRPEDAGLRAHTNYLIFVPAGQAMSSPVPNNTFAETPASLGCVYKVGPI